MLALIQPAENATLTISQCRPSFGATERVFIGLGGNQGEPRHSLALALQRLNQLPYSRVKRYSRPWYTPPWGETGQASFLNLAVELHTGLAPLALLDALLSIEQALGRQRCGRRWGPRLIDTDLLLYGQRIIRHPRLSVPHPFMHQRAFVLCPLIELDPALEIPGLGYAHTWLAQLDTQAHTPADFTFSL